MKHLCLKKAKNKKQGKEKAVQNNPSCWKIQPAEGANASLMNFE